MHTLKSLAAGISTIHPIVWEMSWRSLHYAKFLLPHDPSYKIFPRFIELKPSGLFLDVGANTGVSSLSIRKYSKDYRILALEPNRELEPWLKPWAHRDPLFDYKICGVGDEPGKLSFFCPYSGGVALHTFTSNSKEQIVTAVTESFGERIARGLTFVEVEAEIVTIDSLEMDPSIIKIDAEGFDYQVLVGGKETIARARPFIVVEMSWSQREEISKFFKELDYVETAYDPDTGGLTLAISDVLRSESGRRNLFAVPSELASACLSRKAAD